MTRQPSRIVPLLAVLAIVAAGTTVVLADEPATPGALRVQAPDGTQVEMPLRHTRVAIEVTAFVARATIEQTFANPFDDPVEAVYTFPLGDSAAVDDFELVVGDRVVRGTIRRREEAREVYEAARAAGYQAALLEQERPNIFTQSVANLEPGKTIVVRIKTVETLRYERGTYALAFPLVVGPRYVPGGGAGNGAIATTPSRPSAHVPDAERVTPPVLKPGFRSGHDVEISVVLDAGVPIASIASPSHRIRVERVGGATARVGLDEGDTMPNKDFLLRWSVSSDRPAIGLLAHKDGLDGFFTLLVQPKGEIDAAEAAPKEIVFVVDTSGSMRGAPIEASKRTIGKALHELGRNDTFNLIRFSGDNEVFASHPLPNSRADVERAIAWIERQQGGGGTEMLAALRAAFALPPDPNRVRIVVFFTDGYVGNDPEILGEIGKVVGAARIYTVGIGSSVNHYLLDRMARIGNGAYVFVRPDEGIDDAIEAFRSWVTKPYLTDLTVDWGALAIADVAPERIPDLGSGQTLQLVGRYLRAGEGDVVVRGKLGGRYWEQSLHVALPEREARHDALGSLWARGRIEGLLLSSPDAVTDSVRAEVTALALEHRLMSPFTSFVAVDDTRVVNPTGVARRVHQALPMPDGVSFEGVFGKAGPPALQAETSPGRTEGETEPPPSPGTGGIRIRVLDGKDKSPLIGAIVDLSDDPRHRVPNSRLIADRNGIGFFPAVKAGTGYKIRVDSDGYASVEQSVRVDAGRIADHAIAMVPDQTETVKVAAKRETLDLAAQGTRTKYLSEFISDLPVAGRFYQKSPALPPAGAGARGDGAPNVNRSRDRDFRVAVGGIRGEDPLIRVKAAPVNSDEVDVVDRIESTSPARDHLVDAAFRVLADLADDGKLSPSDGRPALAALLGAQRASGAIADDVATHAIAAWALAEAARLDSGDAWVSAAATKALDRLEELASPAGWPGRPNGTPSAEATLWAKLVMARFRPAVAARVTTPDGKASQAYEALRSAFAQARTGARRDGPSRTGPFERLVASIARGTSPLARRTVGG